MPVQDCKVQLDLLQNSVNEVLLHTGKAIKHAQKHANGDLGEANGILREKLPSSIRSFNHALHDMEREITDAKAVLLRDLRKLQAKRAPPPEPVVKFEDVPEIFSTPTPKAIQSPSSVPLSRGFTPKQPKAPFPNMGGDALISPVSASTPTQQKQQQQQHPIRNLAASIPAASSAAHTVKVMESRLAHAKSSPGLAFAASPTGVKPAVAPQAAPKAVMQEANMGIAPTPSDLNFTNMTFTLATPFNPATSRTTTPTQQPQPQPASGKKPDASQAPSSAPDPNSSGSATKATYASLDFDEGNGAGNGFDDMYYKDTEMTAHGQFDDAFFGAE